jgi:hypothetical protein
LCLSHSSNLISQIWQIYLLFFWDTKLNIFAFSSVLREDQLEWI